MGSDKLKEYDQRLSAQGEAVAELVPAATVVLLRDNEDGLETLLLRKNSKIAFGGMWVFPGGKIDPEDGAGEPDMVNRARIAAVREAREEVDLQVDPAGLHWFSHWTPPPLGNRRFLTWFFAAAAPAAEVCIDEGEIMESRWMHPGQALELQAAGEVELAPPTFVSLYYLARHGNVGAALEALAASPPRHYATHIVADGDELVALWEGDAGYEAHDAAITGPRHRLRLSQGGYQFDDSGVVSGC